jgi:RHS repeat-associated protein
VGRAGDSAEAVDSDAYGSLVSDTTTRQIHVYAGEYWDMDARLLYLRARWYDPRLGRFISADPFEGKPTDPRSLNRYAYAHSDPVHAIDPTGRFALMASPMFSSAVNIGIRVGASGAAAGFMVRIAAQLVRSGVRASHLVKVLTQACATDAGLNNRDCMGELPTFFLGDDYREHTQFVERAQATISPDTLTRSTRNPERWYRGTPECNGRTGRSFGLDCDEYPYVSTEEGGPANYPDRVALEPVPIPDNRGAGAKLGAFYRNGACPVQANQGNKSRFLVVPVVGARQTYGTCGK